MMASQKYYLLVLAGCWTGALLGSSSCLQAQDRPTPDLVASYSIVIPDQASRPNKSDHYFVLPPCPVNQYTSGEIIAVPKDFPSPVLSATLKKGKTPSGTTLFPNGCLVVVDPSLLSVGTYRFAVETADQEGNTATHALTVKLKPSGKEDADAMYAVHQPKALDQYVRGDVLAASQDRDGAIVHSELVKGRLPAGTSLTATGQVVVNDPDQLEAGQYAAWIATEDKQGGTTLFIITLEL